MSKVDADESGNGEKEHIKKHAEEGRRGRRLKKGQRGFEADRDSYGREVQRKRDRKIGKRKGGDERNMLERLK